MKLCSEKIRTYQSDTYKFFLTFYLLQYFVCVKRTRTCSVIYRQVPEKRVPDELGPLKKEIHRLSEENIQLQSLLNELNSSIKDQKKNAIDSKG